MSFSYITATQVQNELRATTNFSASTYPSLNTVNEWIQQESDEVNVVSGRIWGTANYTETIDYQGEETLTLSNAPVVSVTNVLYSTGTLGTALYGLTNTRVENTDYTVYTDDGEVVILENWNPVGGRKNIQINYVAGYAAIPDRIQKLVTKKVAKRTLDSLMQKDVNEKQSGKSVSVGSISIVKPADFGVSQYKQLLSDIDMLEQKLINGTTAYRIASHRY